MRQFALGDHVVIRYGRHQRKKGVIIKCQLVEGYEVKLEDGFVLFYSPGAMAPLWRDFQGVSARLTFLVPARPGCHTTKQSAEKLPVPLGHTVAESLRFRARARGLVPFRPCKTGFHA
jgi:hypothetical protein